MKRTTKKLVSVCLAIALCLGSLSGCKERLDAPSSSSGLDRNMLYNDYANMEKVTGEDAAALHNGKLVLICGEQQVTPVEYITALYEEGTMLYAYSRDSVGNMENLPTVDCSEYQLNFIFENEEVKNVTYQIWNLDQTTLVDDDHNGAPSEDFVMPTEPGEYIGGVIAFWEDGNGQTVLGEHFFKFTF